MARFFSVILFPTSYKHTRSQPGEDKTMTNQQEDTTGQEGTQEILNNNVILAGHHTNVNNILQGP